jgi:hypothetical protein
MRTPLLSFVLLVAYFCCTLSALAANTSRDGNWWKQLPPGMKAAYTTGFLDGVTHSQLLVTAAVLAASIDPKTDKVDANRAGVTQVVGSSFDNAIKRTLNNVTSGQLVAGLDKIYSDYRNYRIDLNGAMIVVLRSMDGITDAEIETLLQNFRKMASDAAQSSK